MKNFTIYENQTTKDVIAVQKGFNIFAFFFTWIYAFIKKWYLAGAILLIINIFSSVISLAMVEAYSTALMVVAKLCFLIISWSVNIVVGLKFNQFYGQFLLAQGYSVVKENAASPNKKMAEITYMNEKQQTNA